MHPNSCRNNTGIKINSNLSLYKNSQDSMPQKRESEANEALQLKRKEFGFKNNAHPSLYNKDDE